MKHQSPAYSITIRLRYPDRPGQLGCISSAIGKSEGSIGAVDIVEVCNDSITRDFTVSTRDEEHAHEIAERVRSIDGVKMVSVSDRTFLLHLGGKIEVRSKIPLTNRDDLSMAYTPGVARICRFIQSDPEAAFTWTIRQNTVAVVTDGSAVLGRATSVHEQPCR